MPEGGRKAEGGRNARRRKEYRTADEMPDGGRNTGRNRKFGREAGRAAGFNAGQRTGAGQETIQKSRGQ